MPIETLLRPDNRLLGLGTGDFSFYGAQPTEGLVTARVNPVEAAVAPAAAADGASAGPGAEPSGLDTAAPAIDADPAAAATPDAASSGSAALMPDAAASGRPTDDGSDAQPPVGGGSTSPLILTPSLNTPADGDQVAGDAATTPAGATGLDGSLAGTEIAQAVQAATSPLLDLLAGGSSALTGPLAQVDAALTGTTQALGDLASGVRGEVAELAGGVRDQVGEPLTATANTLGGLTDTVAGAVQAPVHDIDALIFSGSDPAGGIATLVDLVQSSELFTVGQSTAPAAPDASGSIVDDLVADVAAVPPLLGDDGDHHDLLGDDGPHLGL